MLHNVNIIILAELCLDHVSQSESRSVSGHSLMKTPYVVFMTGFTPFADSQIFSVSDSDSVPCLHFHIMYCYINGHLNTLALHINSLRKEIEVFQQVPGMQVITTQSCWAFFAGVNIKGVHRIDEKTRHLI